MIFSVFISSSFFDPTQSFLFWSQNVNIVRTKLGALCYYKGSSYVKVVNSFLWINICIFSKKAHEFAFHPWKGLSTSLNYPLAIVSNLHHVDKMAKKNLRKKGWKKLNHQQTTLMQKNSTFEELFRKWLEDLFLFFLIIVFKV